MVFVLPNIARWEVWDVGRTNKLNSISLGAVWIYFSLYLLI
jgi:hypothetical protein